MSFDIDLFIGLSMGVAFGFALGVLVMSMCRLASVSDDAEAQA